MAGSEHQDQVLERARAERLNEEQIFFSTRDETLLARAEAAGADRRSQRALKDAAKAHAKSRLLQLNCSVGRAACARLEARVAAAAVRTQELVSAENDAMAFELRAAQNESARRAEAAAAEARLACAEDQLACAEAHLVTAQVRDVPPRVAIAIVVPGGDDGSETRLGIKLGLDCRSGSATIVSMDASLCVALLRDVHGRGVAVGDRLDTVGDEHFIPFSTIGYDGKDEYDSEGSGTVTLDEFLVGVGKAKLDRTVALIASAPRPLGLVFSRERDAATAENEGASRWSQAEYEYALAVANGASDALRRARAAEGDALRAVRRDERGAAVVSDAAAESETNVRALRALLTKALSEGEARRAALALAPAAIASCHAQRDTLITVLAAERARTRSARARCDEAQGETDKAELCAAMAEARNVAARAESTEVAAAARGARDALAVASEGRLRAEQSSARERSECVRLRERELLLASRFHASERAGVALRTQCRDAAVAHKELVARARSARAALDDAENELAWLMPASVALSGGVAACVPKCMLEPASIADISRTASQLASLLDRNTDAAPLTPSESAMSAMLHSAIAEQDSLGVSGANSVSTG